MTEHTCSLFVKSYGPDLPWLKYCLRSIAKYWKGSGETVVVLPPECVAAATPLLQPRQRIVPQEEFYVESYSSNSDRPLGYFFQQAVKLHADQYTNADQILFMDSDTVLTRECSLDDFRDPEHRPILHYEAYDYFRGKHEGVMAWKSMVEAVLRQRVDFEFMRCLPLLYWSDSLKRMRDHIQKVHVRTTWEIVRSCPGGGFSEFNVLGAYIYANEPQNYCWVQTEHPGGNWPCKQFWSWGGLTPQIEMELVGITQ